MDPAITIRRARLDDERTLRDLAGLDSSPRVPGGEVLLAELNGRPVAALSLTDGTKVADPFLPTAQVVELLDVRSRALLGGDPGYGTTMRSAASVARAIRSWTSSRLWRHLPRT